MASGALSAIASLLGVGFGNISEYPVLGNSYCVIMGKFITSFSKISGIILKSSELTAINEGGNNKPYIVPEIKKNFHTITFEKGFGTLDIMKMIDQITVITILIRDHKGNIVGAYYTDRAVVQKVELSDLNAKSSEPIIQKMTIAYNTLKRADKIMDMLSVLNSVGIPSSIVGDTVSLHSTIKKNKDEKKQKEKEKKLAEEKKAQEEARKKQEADKKDALKQVEREEAEAIQKEKEKQNAEKPFSHSAIQVALSQNQAAQKEALAQERAKREEQETLSKIEF